jgi:hypothetical protein
LCPREFRQHQLVLAPPQVEHPRHPELESLHGGGWLYKACSADRASAKPHRSSDG